MKKWLIFFIILLAGTLGSYYFYYSNNTKLYYPKPTITLPTRPHPSDTEHTEQPPTSTHPDQDSTEKTDTVQPRYYPDLIEQVQALDSDLAHAFVRRMKQIKNKHKIPSLLATKDSQGHTILHEAIQHGYRDLAKVLLAYKANPNSKDNDGWTPLHWAAALGYHELYTLLKEYCAHETITTCNDKTACDIFDDINALEETLNGLNTSSLMWIYMRGGRDAVEKYITQEVLHDYLYIVDKLKTAADNNALLATFEKMHITSKKIKNKLLEQLANT